MARELQPDLFGDLRPAPLEPADHPAQRLPWTNDRTPPAPSFLKEEDWRAVLGQIDQLKKRVSELESTQSLLHNRQSELIQATKTRIERMMGSCQRMDEVVKAFTAEISEKFSAVQLRMNERKLSEHKIQDMVDRHASMIQSYEVRLNSLQKILSEQEMQLMNARAALMEAQRRSVAGRL
jgi:chromosome segregation ATPase